MAGFGDFRNDLWKFCRYRSWLFLVLILVSSLSLFSFKNISLKILQTCFSTRTSFPETKCFPMPSPCAFTAPNYTLWGAYIHINFRKEVDDIVFEVDCQKIVVKPGVDIDIGA